MFAIEKDSGLYPELKDKLERLAHGESSLTCHEARKFGYEKEGKLLAHNRFASDVLEWLLPQWAANAVPEDKQALLLLAFIADTVTDFSIGHALLTPGADGHAPLARMIAHMRHGNSFATSCLCLFAAATENAPSFPEGFSFPADSQTVFENLKIAAFAMSILESQRSVDPCFDVAFERKGNKKDLLWNVWFPEIHDTEGLFVIRPVGPGLCEVLGEEEKPMRALAEALVRQRVETKASPFEEMKTAAPSNGSSLATPLPFDPVMVGAPIDSFFALFDGAEAVKQRLKEQVFGEALKNLGPQLGVKGVSVFPNIILSGIPGVGKTSFAKAAAQAFKGVASLEPKAKIGLISCSGLVGEAIGVTEKKIIETMNEHKGGVLILDEVDSWLAVAQFGKNALNTLNGHLGSMAAPPIVIVTLYSENLDLFKLSNKGLSRRFSNVIAIEPYDHATLMKIFAGKIARAGLTVSSDVTAKASDYLEREHRARGTAFANAGAVDTLVSEMWRKMAGRMVERYPELLSGNVKLAKLDTFSAIKADAAGFVVSDVPEFTSGWHNPIVKEAAAVPQRFEGQTEEKSNLLRFPLPSREPA